MELFANLGFITVILVLHFLFLYNGDDLVYQANAGQGNMFCNITLFFLDNFDNFFKKSNKF